MIETLPVVERFYSIQGEGCHSGKPVYFIRLGGCDVCCSFCDSRSTWNAKRFPQISIDQLVSEIKDTPAQAVVITGGEPCMHNLDSLCSSIHDKGMVTFLETSGSHTISGKWDWICLSPKLNKIPLDENLLLANELKVVIQNPYDLEWAEENAAKVSDNCLLFLQPEWSVHEEITPVIIDYIKQNPVWNISLQLHKFIGVQ